MSMKGNKSKRRGSPSKTGSEVHNGPERDTRYQISVGVGCLFASLWLIFLALYIQRVTDKSCSAAVSQSNPCSSGEEEGLKVTFGPQSLHKPEKIGEVNGDDVMKYTMKNKNNVMVELISIGARINKFVTKDGKDIVVGFNSEPESDLSDFTNHKFGAIDGPVCGRDASNFHQINFESQVDSAGEVKFTTSTEDMNITVTYSLNEDNELKLEVTANAKRDKQPKIDLCSAMHFKMDTSADISDHRVLIESNKYHSSHAGIEDAAEGSRFDFRAATPPSRLITYVLEGNPKLEMVQYAYDLDPSFSGLTKAAEISSTRSSAKASIKTNQKKVEFYVITAEDFSVTGKQVYSAQTFVGLFTRRFAPVQREEITLNYGSDYSYVNVYTVE